MSYFIRFVKRFLGRRNNASPRVVAKERLEKVIVQDRIKMEPKYLDTVRRDIIKAVSKHMQIEKQNVAIEVTHDGTSLLLSVKAPVRKIHRSGAAKAENCYDMVKADV